MSDIKNFLDIVEEYSEEDGLIEAQDSFDIELGEDLLIETGVVDIIEDGIVVEGDEETLKLLAKHGLILEESDWSKYDEPTVARIKKGVTEPVDRTDYNTPPAMRDPDQGKPGYEKRRSRIMKGITEAYINSTEDAVELLAKLRDIGKGIENYKPYDGNFANLCANYLGDVWNWLEPRVDENDPKLQPILNDVFAVWKRAGQLQRSPESGSNRSLANDIVNSLYPLMQWVELNRDKIQSVKVREDEVDEAKYHGKEVPLGKKLPGDVKKSKVYVRKPNGKVVKVNFGDKNMRIKKSNPKRRKSFRARHNCKNPGPRWKARYWSCRAW